MTSSATVDHDTFADEVFRWANILYFRSTTAESLFVLPPEETKDGAYANPINEVEIQKMQNISIDIAGDKTIRLMLCAALKSISKDLGEISKIVVGVLLPISLLGNVHIPLNPIVYAGICLVIFNSGIAAYCQGVG